MIDHHQPAMLTPEEMEIAVGKHVAWPTFDRQGALICKAQIRKMVQWLEEKCDKHRQYGTGIVKPMYFFCQRYECPECRQSLRKAAGLEIK